MSDSVKPYVGMPAVWCCVFHRFAGQICHVSKSGHVVWWLGETDLPQRFTLRKDGYYRLSGARSQGLYLRLNDSSPTELDIGC